MSQQIRFTETHTFESSRHSNLDFQNLQASPLPGAPLVSFDLHFDNLKVPFISGFP